MGKNRSRVFIGSSREAMPYVDAVQSHLSYDAEVTPWNSAFKVNNYTMEDLETQLDQNDFGVFICSPDDVITIRGTNYLITRDNTLFEMGLFWGKLRKGRVFFLIPNKTRDMKVEDEERLLNYHLLSDLLGINHPTYEIREDSNYEAAVRVACSKIISVIKREGPFTDPRELYEQASLRIKSLNIASKFSAELAKKLLKSPEQIHQYIAQNLKSKYGIPPGFEISDIGFWKREGEEGLSHIVGEEPSREKFYEFNVNTDKDENSSERVLVVDSYNKSDILSLLFKDGLYKTYLICYPIATEGVLTVTLSAIDDEAELTDEELNLYIAANKRLMSTIDYIFGGVSN